MKGNQKPKIVKGKHLTAEITFDSLGHMMIDIKRNPTEQLKFVYIKVDGKNAGMYNVGEWGNSIDIHQEHDKIKSFTVYGDIEVKKGGWIKGVTAPDDIVHHTIKITERVNLNELRGYEENEQ